MSPSMSIAKKLCHLLCHLVLPLTYQKAFLCRQTKTSVIEKEVTVHMAFSSDLVLDYKLPAALQFEKRNFNYLFLSRM